MCGIFGAIGPITNSINKSHISIKMIESLKHRGPDNSDFISLNNGFIGHTRLSLVDLSDAGNQPMRSSKGNIISFNGEIYNFLELSRIFNIKLNTKSDTEVLMLLIEKIGFENALNNLKGMFAIAYYSTIDNTLYLSRDRMGEKPLYYYRTADSILFASDLDAIVKSGLVKIEISDISVNEFFKYSYICSPNSIYKNIKKLSPGENSIVKFSNNKIISFQLKRWFNIKSTFDHEFKSNSNYNEIVDQSHDLIISSVKSQTFADAKVGSFLSGGIDSSIITAIMAKELNQLETFTIGSSDNRFDESEAAKKFANHLGTSHNLINFNEVDLEYHLDNIAKAYSEPLADSSQIATSIVSELASKKVKAVLTGDGGDELFGGYNRYENGLKFWKKLKRIGFNSLSSQILNAIEVYSPEFIFTFISKFGVNNPKDKIRKLKLLNKIQNLENYYSFLMSNSLVDNLNYLKKSSEQKIELYREKNLSDEAQLCLWDQLYYLPNDNLAKIDRMTMFYSLEARAPFLDKELLCFINKVDYRIKNKNGSKSILRKIHSKYYPPDLVDFNKRGFSIPLDNIMKKKAKRLVLSLVDV